VEREGGEGVGSRGRGRRGVRGEDSGDSGASPKSRGVGAGCGVWVAAWVGEGKRATRPAAATALAPSGPGARWVNARRPGDRMHIRLTQHTRRNHNDECASCATLFGGVSLVFDPTFTCHTPRRLRRQTPSVPRRWGVCVCVGGGGGGAGSTRVTAHRSAAVHGAGAHGGRGFDGEVGDRRVIARRPEVPLAHLHLVGPTTGTATPLVQGTPKRQGAWITK